MPFAIITIYSGKAFIGGDKITFIRMITFLIIMISYTAYLFHKRVKITLDIKAFSVKLNY